MDRLDIIGYQKILGLTDGIFETGAIGVPRKLQNPTVLSQGGPFSTQCSNPFVCDMAI